MKYTVYQINRERDAERVKFLSYDGTMRVAGRINPEIYDKVYEGEIEKVSTQEKDEWTMERIFKTLNTNKRPSDFKGHSLSVSDIVELPSGRWFCDSMGWKQLEA